MNTLKIVLFGIKNNKILGVFMFLICGFVFPIIAFISDPPSYSEIAYTMLLTFSLICAYFSGCVFPLIIFSYTHNRRLNDFYAAMPVKKRQYFWGYFFSGIILFIIPFILMHVIFIILFGAKEDMLRFKDSLGIVIIFLSLYCSMTLSVMFSGSAVSGIIAFAIRNGFVICLVAPVLFMSGVNLASYFVLLYDKAIISSPILGGLGYLLKDGYDYGIGLWMLIIAVLETIAAFFLHKYRSGETTMALAFPKSRYPYQYLVTLIFVMTVNAAILISLGYSNGLFDNRLIDSAFSEDFLSHNPYDIKAVVFFDIVGALMIFVILNIVLERSSRAAFKKMRHLVFFLVGFFALSFLSNSLLSYIPKIYTPIDPDFAIVSIYAPADSSAVLGIDEEELSARRMSGEYICNVYYETDEQSRETKRVISNLMVREKRFAVTDRKALAVLKKICEGETLTYNICASTSITPSKLKLTPQPIYKDKEFGLENDLGRSVKDNRAIDPKSAVIYKILLAKGELKLYESGYDKTVCKGFIIQKGISREGYTKSEAYELFGCMNYEMSTSGKTEIVRGQVRVEA